MRVHVSWRVLSVIFFCVLVMPLARVRAADLHVPNQYRRISDAVKAAQPGDRVVVAPGVYSDNISIRKNVAVVSEAGAARTVIDGGDHDTVVLVADARFDGERSPRVSGFTIRNGKSSEGRGGGITVYNADVVIENNVIVSNRAHVDGGGILFNRHSDGFVRNNVIEHNHGGRFGGGVMIVGASHPAIFNNTFNFNKVEGHHLPHGGPSGGAIFVDGNSSPQIVGNTLNHNHAAFAGGAISLRVGAHAVVEDNHFTGNSAPYGGGLHIETEGATTRVAGNNFHNNVADAAGYAGAGFGGAISVYNQSRPVIVNNRLINNVATSGGAGIAVAEHANGTIAANTLVGNVATSSGGEGGGVYIAHATMDLYNNVIAKNKADKTGAGIALLDGAAVRVFNNTVAHNTVNAAAATPAADAGIFVRDKVAAADIVNNILAKNTGYQIFEEYPKATIRNNVINNDGNGAYFNWRVNAIHDVATVNARSEINAVDNISGSEGFVDEDYRVAGDSVAINRGTTGLSVYDRDYRLRKDAPDIGAHERGGDTPVSTPVYRFWSEIFKHHFYTIDKKERDHILASGVGKEWRYEGDAFRALPLRDCHGAPPVHRFWSDTYRGHFYTINDSEKRHVRQTYPSNVWRYEGEAYCAHTTPALGTTELYRFWSDTYRGHFYTISAAEKQHIQQTYPDNVWRYEGVGFYVYPAQ